MILKLKALFNYLLKIKKSYLWHRGWYLEKALLMTILKFHHDFQFMTWYFLVGAIFWDE